MNKAWIKWTVLLLPLVALAGCSGQQDLQAWVAQVRASKPPVSSPVPPVIEQPPFGYQDESLRSPFAEASLNPAGLKSSAALPSIFSQPKQPLQFFPLDALKMVGTIKEGSTDSALVEDPNSKVYLVSKGDYMGEHYGKVLAIAPTSISLSELVPDDAGGWKQKPTSIALYTQAGSSNHN